VGFLEQVNNHGTVVRTKARFVAQDNDQIKGLDFSETFAPVIRGHLVPRD
jgi:hypothetical protein